MIFYTNEPGVYGRFLDIQIAKTRGQTMFGTRHQFPLVETVDNNNKKRKLINTVFNAYKIKFKRL